MALNNLQWLICHEIETNYKSVCSCMYLSNPSPMSKMWHKVNFLSGKKLVWIQFSFSLSGCLTKAKEPTLHYYLPIAGKRTGSSEMQTALSRIWTRVTNSISEDDYSYTKSTCTVHVCTVRFALIGCLIGSWLHKQFKLAGYICIGLRG